VDFVANGGEKWSAAAGLIYQKGYQYQVPGTTVDAESSLNVVSVDTISNSSTVDTTLNQVTIDGKYKLNDAWKFRIYERFDMVSTKWEEQQYTIVRDLHCWIAELTLSYGDARNTSIWLVMKLKAFPDSPIGMRQVYSRPRFGEAGAR
jgi:hypothetical protein